MTAPIVLEVETSKRYGGRLVLDRARLAVRAGTVHALVGENGAGKSTLVKIACGVIAGEATTLSVAAPPGLVPQHGALVPTLTLVENAVLGAEPTRGGLLALDATADRLRAIGERHGLKVDPSARAGALSVGEQQRAEIVIALARGARVLVLDEPTAVLAPVEVAGLFDVLRAHVAGGGAVVIVTHKLDEVVELADEVTVLRAGKVVATMRKEDGLRADAIATAMVGETEVPRSGTGTGTGTGTIGLRVEVGEVKLAIERGEIVGIAGVEGNGQTELVRAIAGLDRAKAGAIRIGDRDVTRASVAARHAAGLGHVAEDRHATGLLLDASVEDNCALGRHRELGWVIDRAARRAIATRIVTDFDVRPPDLALPARALSGGNQQKIVVGRELTRPGLKALVAAQPTRGVDVAAQALIHTRLRAAAAAGVAILVVSADLDELLALCGRVCVMHRGRIAGELAGEALAAADARARLGAWMTGAEAA